MKKPDAFNQMVGKVYKDSTWPNTIQAPDAIALLRRQHARVVRLVKTQQRWKHNSLDQLVTEPDGEWLRRGDLLAALAQMKRGK